MTVSGDIDNRPWTYSRGLSSLSFIKKKVEVLLCSRAKIMLPKV